MEKMDLLKELLKLFGFTSADVEKLSDHKLQGTILKLDEEERIVYGWASVIEEKGAPVVDLQGDIIPEAVLRSAAHDFIEDTRAGKVMHVGTKKGRIVESIVLTKDLQKALGIDLQKVGWLIGYKVDDAETWAKVKSGDLKMFSIGGQARSEPMED